MRASRSPESPDDQPLPLWRRVLPFVVAAALVGFVLATLDLRDFVHHLGTIDYPLWALFAVAQMLVVLVLDAFATAHVYRRVLGPIRYRDFLLIRGASYLPGLVNHHVGQAWLTYYLSRTQKTRLWRTAGATLLVYATTFAALFVFAAASLVLAPSRFAWLPPIVIAAGVAGATYLGVLAARPKILRDRHLTAPLVEVGALGHLRATALRLPHVVAIFLGAWVPFYFFGVDIPLADALALVPPLLVIVALPVTPQGVGTRDAFATNVFLAYAAGATPAEQRAVIAACTLTWAVTLTLIQIAIGAACLPAARRLMNVSPGGVSSAA